MLLKYRGIDILPEQSAMGTYDSVYDGYGNWPFSTAYAGSYGFTTYVEYEASMDDLKREIIKGNPVAISVKYRNSESVPISYPVVHGAPIPSTGGHLVVVCGFTKIDGKDYVVVNDAAAANDSGVRLKYLLSEFDSAWATEKGSYEFLIFKKTGDSYRAKINWTNPGNIINKSFKGISHVKVFPL